MPTWPVSWASTPGERVPLADAREAVLAQRRLRGMVLDADDHDTWSCGSFFTNPILSAQRFAALESRAATRLGPDAPTPPRFTDADGNVKTSAAWLIDKAGFEKGFALPGSGAALSTKHTLAITNRGEATADDVAAAGPAPPAGGPRRVRGDLGQRAGVCGT